MEYYQKNMTLLKEKFNGVFKKINNAETSDRLKTEMKKNDGEIAAIIKDKKNKFDIYVEKARRNGYTMRVKKDEQNIYFHSKYTPGREAEKVVKNFGFSAKKQIFVLGSGLGYYLEQFDKDNKFDKIIVIEPYLSIFYAALCFNDLSNFLNSNKIILIIENDEQIFDIVRRNVNISLNKEIAFLEHAPSLKLFSQKYSEIYKFIKETINFQKVNIATDIEQARKWRNNIISNIPYIFKSPKADDFFGKCKNIPAMCVAAGPSLDKNIKYLKGARGRSIILCVDTAVNALLKEGIHPDIVVTMDAKENNYLNHLSGSLEELKESTIILSEFATHPLLHQNWNGKTIFFTMKRNFSGWIEKNTGNYSVLETGGTVSHSMVDFAYKIGANPVILVGQDLAYTDRKSHASGTAFANRKIGDKKLIEVEGIEGKVYTDKAFLSMLSFFNNYFNIHTDRIFVDATEGGAKLKNVKIEKLEETLNKYCKKNINIKEKLNDIYKKYKNDQQELTGKLKRELKNTYEELIESIKISEKQIAVIRDVLTKLQKEKNISDRELENLELSFAKYEKHLHQTTYLSYFVERVLIPERMKLKSAKNKYYIDKKASLKKRSEVYYNFRKKFLAELKESLHILEENYFDEKA